VRFAAIVPRRSSSSPRLSFFPATTGLAKPRTPRTTTSAIPYLILSTPTSLVRRQLSRRHHARMPDPQQRQRPPSSAARSTTLHVTTPWYIDRPLTLTRLGLSISLALFLPCLPCRPMRINRQYRTPQHSKSQTGPGRPGLGDAPGTGLGSGLAFPTTWERSRRSCVRARSG